MTVKHPSRRAGRRRVTAALLAGTATVALSAGLAAPTHAAPTDRIGEILGADAPNVITGSYIVTLKGGHRSTHSGKELAKAYGGTVQRTFDTALNGFSVTLSEAEAKRLSADPAVDKVMTNQRVFIAGTQNNPPSWGLDRIDQVSLPLNKAYSYPDSAGGGVTAYIIDTGVRISHQDFGGRAVSGFDAIDGGVADDAHGHGTHVAATVGGNSYGVAKKVKIVAVRVLDGEGSGSIDQVLAGIDWVTKNAKKPAVANMSLGGFMNSALDTAVRNSIASGVTYAVAAGNSSFPADFFSPARVSEAITVGATENNDARASYSNYGGKLDLFAPGSSITSAWPDSDSANKTISGTSMASPHAAGAAAVYLSGHPDATPAQVSNALVSGAATGKVTGAGLGSPNRLLQVTP